MDFRNVTDLFADPAFDGEPVMIKEIYGEKARKVIEALLDKYANKGIENIENLAVLRIEPFNEIGTPAEIIKLFGGKKSYLRMIKELESELYKEEA